jgi:hypothetical protein
MARLCRCGKIVKDACDCGRGTSTQRRSSVGVGYGRDHRDASEQYRADHPLCERCVMLYGAMDAQPSRDMHHIQSIKDAPQLRMIRSNWLALCRPCHEALEGSLLDGQAVKRWSEASYNEACYTVPVGEPGASKKSEKHVVDCSHSLPCASPKLGG